MAYLGTSPSKTTPTYKQVYEYTATAGQTTFTASYTAGYVSVFRNGVQLSSPDFTATNGTSVVLANACTSGDAIRIESMFVNSQLNAIPNTAGAVATSNIADNAITTAKIAPGAVIPADLAQPLTLGTTVTLTNQTSVDFTGIPSWAKRITIMFNGISLNNNRGAVDSFAILLGTSAGIETSGYTGSVTELVNAGGILNASVTARFSFAPYTSAAAAYYGTMVLTSMGSNSWTCTSILSGNQFYNATGLCGASKTLSGTLDRIRFTTTNGTDVIDAGSINIMYEG